MVTNNFLFCKPRKNRKNRSEKRVRTVLKSFAVRFVGQAQNYGINDLIKSITLETILLTFKLGI